MRPHAGRSAPPGGRSAPRRGGGAATYRPRSARSGGTIAGSAAAAVGDDGKGRAARVRPPAGAGAADRRAHGSRVARHHSRAQPGSGGAPWAGAGAPSTGRTFWQAAVRLGVYARRDSSSTPKSGSPKNKSPPSTSPEATGTLSGTTASLPPTTPRKRNPQLLICEP